MKRMTACMGLLAVMLAQSAMAFRPSGWVYMDWPWAYDSEADCWNWFRPDDTQWVYGYPPADGWKKMEASALARGWTYHAWPFVYGQSNDAWYYINEANTQWVVNMDTAAWSLFGVAAVPAGMALIPGGTNAGTDPDFGAYSLTVSSFFMDRYEVTKTLWDEVYTWAIANGYTFDNAGGGKAADHPVHTVNWYDVVKWCNARSQKGGRTPVYYTDDAKTQVYRTGQVDALFVQETANGYRLPTEAQWEYAARGGVAGRRFPWLDSDEIQHARANYVSRDWESYDTSPTRGTHPDYSVGDGPYTSPVGVFAANGYGLHDLAGNVMEWCFDSYYFQGQTEPSHVVRGGYWNQSSSYCRVGSRYWDRSVYADYDMGFRSVFPAH